MSEESASPEKEQWTLRLPRANFANHHVFGMDFGSSAIKIVCVKSDGDELSVRLNKIPRARPNEAVTFLKEQCGQLQTDETYSLAGIGVAPHKQLLEEGLGITCTGCSEIDTLVDGFNLAAKYIPWDDFVLKPNLVARSEGKQSGSKLRDAMFPFVCPPERTDQWIKRDNDVPRADAVQYPLLLCNLGSDHMLIKVEEDGRYEFVVCYTLGGRTLLGLARLLLGLESFDDILELAVRGDSSKVDSCVGDTLDDSDEACGVARGSSMKAFSFGKVTMDNDDYSREDIAAGLVSMVTNSAAKDAFNWATQLGVTQVYFTGGLANSHTLIRHQLERDFTEMNYCNTKALQADCIFPRGGGHFAALGSLVINMGTKP